MSTPHADFLHRLRHSAPATWLRRWFSSLCRGHPDGTYRFSRSGRVLSLLFVFLPAIVTGAFTLANAVNIPVWDDWERGVLLQKFSERSPDFFTYLTAPHIDHRIVVPRLIILASNSISGGDLRWEIAISFALYLLGATCLFLVLKRTLGPTPWMLFTGFLVNVALFSPVQYQNFLWAIQIAMLLPFACLGLMLFAFQVDWRWPAKLAVVVACAWVGSHSFGHGLILWPVALLVAACHPGIDSRRNRLLVSGGIALAGALTIATYFTWNFRNVTSHAYGQLPGEVPPGVKNFAARPDEIADFVVAGVGNAAGRLFPDVLTGAPITGKGTLLVLILVLSGWAGLLWRSDRRREDWGTLLPWLAAAGFALATLLAIALGRSIQGWEKAVMSRYAGPSVLLAAALIAMASGLLARWRDSTSTREKRESYTRLALVAALLWLGVQVPTWSHSLHKMTQWKQARLQQRAALVYLDHFEPTKISRQDHTLEFFSEQARYLDSQGWLSPPLFERTDFGEFTPTTILLPQSRATVTNASLTPGGVWVGGFATLRKPDRIADGVLVTARRWGEVDEASWTVVEMAEMDTVFFQPNMALDNIFGGARNLYRPRYHASWHDLIPLDRFPPGGPVEIAFWAMDADQMRLQRLKPVLRFDPESSRVGTNLLDTRPD